MKFFFHKHFVSICIGLEMGICLTLVSYIYQKNYTRSVLGSISATFLQKEDLIFPADSPLRYYYEPKPNSLMEDAPDWLGYTASYTINSDSLNERYDYAVDRPKDTYRIVALGDSFTFGHYVNTKDNWTERLEDKLNANPPCNNYRHYDVINLGLSGYDVQYITYRYKNRGKKYAPDLIIWNESGSGFTRIRELLYPLVDRYTQGLNSQENEILQKHPGANIAGKKAQDELNQEYGQKRLSEQINASWADFFDVRGHTPVVITTYSFVTPANINTLKHLILNKENVFMFAFIPPIDELSGVLPDGHPNAKGHEIIAESTIQYLQDNGIIACVK